MKKELLPQEVQDLSRTLILQSRPYRPGPTVQVVHPSSHTSSQFLYLFIPLWGNKEAGIHPSIRAGHQALIGVPHLWVDRRQTRQVIPVTNPPTNKTKGTPVFQEELSQVGKDLTPLRKTIPEAILHQGNQLNTSHGLIKRTRCSCRCICFCLIQKRHFETCVSYKWRLSVNHVIENGAVLLLCNGLNKPVFLHEDISLCK